MDIIIGNEYKLDRRIGEGSFGKVYIAKDSETNEELAIKLEHVRKNYISNINVWKSCKAKEYLKWCIMAMKVSITQTWNSVILDGIRTVFGFVVMTFHKNTY